jgi:hypothetical protein
MTVSLPLDWLRSLQNSFLPDVCDVSRYVETNTADGVTQDWQVVATGLPCRLSSRTTTATEAVGGSGQLRAVGDWLIWLEAFADVTVKDRVILGTRTFEVEKVVGESYETARALSCTEVI